VVSRLNRVMIAIYADEPAWPTDVYKMAPKNKHSAIIRLVISNIKLL